MVTCELAYQPYTRQWRVAPLVLYNPLCLSVCLSVCPRVFEVFSASLVQEESL